MNGAGGSKSRWLIAASSAQLQLGLQQFGLAGIQANALFAPELPARHNLDVLNAVEVGKKANTVTGSDTIQNI